MKNRMIGTLLLASLAWGAALPALAQTTRPAADQQAARTQMPRPDARQMAERLRAAGTSIGITRDQAPAWDAYLRAVVAAAAAGPGSPPQGGPKGQPGKRPDGQPLRNAQGHPPPPPIGQPDRREGHPALLLGEMMARHATGDRARALSRAAAGLRAVLSPQQLAALMAAEAPPGASDGRPALPRAAN